MGGRTIRQSAVGTSNPTRAVTLLEVIVAVSAAAVIVGLALGILIATNKTANEHMGHEWLVQQAQLDMNRVRSVLEGVVWPEDLASPPSGGDGLVFASDAVAVFSSHRPTTGGQFCHYSIGLRKDEGEEGRVVAGLVRRIPGSDQTPRFEALGGEYDASITFRYATTVGKDLKPEWQESLAAGEKPRLVFVDLIVRDPGQLDDKQIDIFSSKYDENGDGNIDAEERKNFKMPEAVANFYDRDGDGVIARDEIVEFVQLNTAIEL
jgi:hypothetical protein